MILTKLLYANHPLIDTVYSTKTNRLSKDVYINCSCIINALNEENLEKAQKMRLFAEFIRDKILT